MCQKVERPNGALSFTLAGGELRGVVDLLDGLNAYNLHPAV